MLDYITDMIKEFINRPYFKKHFDWFIYTFALMEKSNKMENNRTNNLHPVRPRKGDIYLIEFGQNVGKELCNTHMGIIMQNSLKKQHFKYSSCNSNFKFTKNI